MKRTILMLAALALLLGGVGQANAGYYLLTSRAGLSDFVDWGQLGPTYSSAPNPSNVTSNNGLSLTVSKTQPGDFGRRDQGNGWSGNFANGDHLLWTQDFNDNPDTISLNHGFSAGGTQIQSDNFGAFTAQVTAYDQNGNSLASFTVNGNSTSNGDNSAVFLGIGTTGGSQIYSLGFSLISAPANSADFAINTFSFSTGPNNVVPEPSSLTLLGIGAFGLIGLVRRRRKAAVAA